VREAFVKTEEFQRIRQLIADAVERHGLVEGATPKRCELWSPGFRDSSAVI
jgi:hypothetical protein